LLHARTDVGINVLQDKPVAGIPERLQGGKAALNHGADLIDMTAGRGAVAV
jgi:hypothetical protein